MAASPMRSVNARAAYARQGPSSDECTLILRGIACRLTQQDVKHILDEAGLRGKFSFVCAPRISARGSNLGYAFVRFRTLEYARECHRRCHGRPFGPAAPEKVCDVSFAKNQGDASAILQMSRRRLGGQDPGLLLCRDLLPQAVAPAAWGGEALRPPDSQGASGQRGPELGCVPAQARCRPEASSSSSGSWQGSQSARAPWSRPSLAESFICDLFEDVEIDSFGISACLHGGPPDLGQAGHQSRNF